MDKDKAVWEAVSQDLFLVLSHPGALEAAGAMVSEPLLLQLTAIFALPSDTGLAGNRSRGIEVSPHFQRNA